MEERIMSNNRNFVRRKIEEIEDEMESRLLQWEKKMEKSQRRIIRIIQDKLERFGELEDQIMKKEERMTEAKQSRNKEEAAGNKGQNEEEGTEEGTQLMHFSTNVD